MHPPSEFSLLLRDSVMGAKCKVSLAYLESHPPKVQHGLSNVCAEASPDLNYLLMLFENGKMGTGSAKCQMSIVWTVQLIPIYLGQTGQWELRPMWRTFPISCWWGTLGKESWKGSDTQRGLPTGETKERVTMVLIWIQLV